jgi:hypothetical protein
MRTTTAEIRTLIDKIDRDELRLPEIQRGYVWKPPKVAGLIDSLYRQYPTGSLLFWETDEEVIERDSSIDGPNVKPLAKPQYLIDGQQRLTSLHRVFKGHEGAQIVFNIESEKFQNQSAATKKDPRWIRVCDVLGDAADLFTLVEQLQERLPDFDRKDMHSRLEKLRKIGDYSYWIEIVENLPYEAVADIFVRVNSRGVTLRSVDLALATLSARWRVGVIEKLDNEAQKWGDAGYRALDVPFLARCLAALSTDAGGFRGFASATPAALEDAWGETQRGVHHLVQLLKNNANVATSELLPSNYPLVPLVAYLGSRPDESLDTEKANALIYWLLGAFIQARYSSATETVLGQDLAAIRSGEALTRLFRNLRLFGQRLVVTSDSLAGRTERSPYLLLSYLAAKRSGAKDWWHGVDIGMDAQGNYKLEYHHVHPRATLRNQYSKNEINDLANFAFISSKANKKISDRQPAQYFREIGDDQLEAHLIPRDESFRTPDRYEDFIRARRELLADAMTEVLDSFAPASLTGQTEMADPAAGERLSLVAYGDSAEDPNAVLSILAASNGTSWEATIPFRDFRFFISDLENGYSAALTVGGETVELESGADEIELPLGPLVARGTLEEWRAVLDRELIELTPNADRPELPAEAAPWSGERKAFPISDSE